MTTDVSLFPDLLGEAWHQLAAPVKQLHGGRHSMTTQGRADVYGATHRPARWLRRLLGLPGPGLDQPVQLRIERRGTTEVWTRHFASGQMRSALSRGPQGGLRERLGPVTLHFALHAVGGAIDWRLRGATLLGVPVPRRMLGKVSARSGSAGDAYLFEIEARLPLLGTWIGYRGRLAAGS